MILAKILGVCSPLAESVESEKGKIILFSMAIKNIQTPKFGDNERKNFVWKVYYTQCRRKTPTQIIGSSVLILNFVQSQNDLSDDINIFIEM